MEAYAAMASPIDKLSCEIFALLETRLLYGAGNETPAKEFLLRGESGRVRVLAIDGCGSGAEDALLAAAALARLEAELREQAGDPDARVADFFDLAAGAGAGGVLAAMLFLRGPDGRPRYSAQDALAFVSDRAGKGKELGGGRRGRWGRLFGRGGDRSSLRRVFGDATLRDTVAPLLVPCYDLATAAPFVFSRADAVEADAFDFRLRDVCAATCASTASAPAPVIRSVDGVTAIAAASAAVAGMGNPAAAAVTHVLHNKQEFPLANGVEDILVLSIGSGTSTATISSSGSATPMPTRSPSPRELARVTGEGVADMVDESVAMAFGHACGSNYVRIQAAAGKAQSAAAMLAQRNVESVLFRGRRLSERTNAEKVDALVAELVKEQERRRCSPHATVAIKQAATPSPPRLSSATTASSGTTTTTRTASTMASPLSCDSRR